MSDETINAVLAVYPNRGYADAAADYLKRLDKSDVLHVDGVAIVAKDLNGKVSAERVGSLTGKKGVRRGAAVGAVVGMIFPPSVVGTTLVGMGIGGLIGRARGSSGTNSALQAMGEQVDRGHAGIIVIVGDDAVDDLIGRLTGYESIHRTRVDAKTLTTAEPEPTVEVPPEIAESSGPPV